MFTVILQKMKNNQQKEFEELIKKNFDINQIDNGTTLLHEVCKHPKVSPLYLGLLFKKSADFTIKDQYGRTPLHYSCLNSDANAEVLATLLTFHFFGKRADPNIIDNSGKTALHYLCMNEKANAGMAKLLFVYKISPNIQDNEKQTALHFACKCGVNEEVIETLLDNGVDPNLLDNGSNNPLHYACINLDVSIGSIGKILEKTKNFINKSGHTPIHWLCMEEKPRLRILECLLENRYLQKIITQENGQKSPLHFACMQKNLNDNVLQILLEKGLNLYAKDKEGTTPLHCLFMNKEYTNNIELLPPNNNSPLKKQKSKDVFPWDIDTSYSEHQKCTLADVLMYVCRSEKPSGKIVQYLISKGAKYDLKNADEQNCLHLACMNKSISVDIIKILIEKETSTGCDVFNKNFLDYAFENGSLLKELISKEFEAIHQSHIWIDAVVASNIETIKKLIDSDMNLFSEDKYGHTLLTKSCEKKDINKIKLFLSDRMPIINFLIK